MHARRMILKAAIAMGLGVAMVSVPSLIGSGSAQAQEKTVRIGFQKYGKLVLLKSKGSLETRLKALGWNVKWTEFSAGPALLEAINVGALDFGNTGEAPPIFAQAAGAPIRYVAYEPPAPKGEAILVPKGSPIKSVAELKGKKVALNKGSNVHYLLVKALEKANVKYSDITPVFLAPADARAAFERGAVDAWVIWDPFQAAAEAAIEATILADGTDTVSNYQFYLSSQKFLESDPKVVDAILEGLREVDDWAKTDIKAVAEQLSPSVGLPVPVLEVALKRQAYGIKPIDRKVITEQQQLADTFLALGLIPKAITVADAAGTPAP
ncbi:sulfonate transport system substrate-binding protein [Bradyrhizobium sp. NFR13]|uniref:sulfonate ABC transporter substrate-binding protein n=1 Tax=Bradyrhizobium sp. NFR13 TaxID=1566285 RepID=UPI0008E2238C|nr:sulfonate ABC transporter substrate-binding protein [Bradyrhizobium sp. NFR13]SFM09920.1 sulfonate transport system substrate-binding protein [Bradyrhizobium sp. NFR13]